jgi:hypothetical protein
MIAIAPLTQMTPFRHSVRLRPNAVNMRKHNVILGSLPALVLFAALTVAQTAEPKHEPDVLYVPTTEEAAPALAAEISQVSWTERLPSCKGSAAQAAAPLPSLRA